MKTWKRRFSAAWLGIIIGYLLNVARIGMTASSWFLIGQALSLIAFLSITGFSMWIFCEVIFSPPDYHDDDLL